ncbi:hypothetical protein BE17_02545, partial [Sorangium cellulosum]
MVVSSLVSEVFFMESLSAMVALPGSEWRREGALYGRESEPSQARSSAVSGTLVSVDGGRRLAGRSHQRVGRVAFVLLALLMSACTSEDAPPGTSGDQGPDPGTGGDGGAGP